MGLFGKKKKLWDEARVQENKARMHALFEQVVEDSAGYQLVYAYSSSIKTSNYILARKTTYTYTSLIVGFRESDMSIVILQTTPELEGCSDPAYFNKGRNTLLPDTAYAVVRNGSKGYSTGNTTCL